MKSLGSLAVILIIFSGCFGKERVQQILENNPEILANTIKKNPTVFIDALNEAVKKAQVGQAKKREEDEEQKLAKYFDSPLIPKIRKDELIRGTKDAPITLVEYSDFECPFCKRGFETVLSLLEKYKGKVQFIYKHLPLSFHQTAMIASQYYEAIRLQSEDKAIKFHDAIYDQQTGLRQGEKFLKSLAKKAKVNMKRLAQDLKNPKVQKRIDEDLAEAKKFDFQGTPGFLLNGVPIKGAYPTKHFEMIVKKLQEKGKLVL